MADVIIHRNSGNYIASQVIWAVLWVVNVILGLRFVLKLIAANPAASFTQLVYNASAPLLNPFANIVRSSSTGTGGVLEWSTLIGMVVYWLIAAALVRLIWFTTESGPTYVERV